MSKKEITIYDLANRLSVSTATVSRALNDDPVVKKKTRKAIQEAAKELGYRRNTFASNLRNRKSRTIGVIVHELNSSFITSVLAGIEKVMAAAGYDLIIAHSSENFEKEASNALNLFHKRVDGLIASLAFNTEDLDHYNPFIDKGIPLVFFDRVEEHGDTTRVIIDNYTCGYQATRHLVEQGCRNIVLVTGNLKRNVYAQRHTGYRDALLHSNIPYDRKLVLIKDLSVQGGIEAAMDILQMSSRPDGAFITNDFSAAVCMQTLKQHGVHIPGDIAVVGFNDDAISTIVEPNLTTVRYPGIDMGEIAANNLLEQMRTEGNNNPGKTIIVRSDLVIRKSSLKKQGTTMTGQPTAHKKYHV